MDDQYDAIVLGTGLKECIISGLLSVDGLKVLHMDRNNYYGGASASLNLNQLFEQFRPSQRPNEALGASRDYNVDLIPKFILASGLLVKMLIHTDVTRYLEFKVVDGSYVYRQGKIHKVPASDVEALKSNLMGLFEKRRCKKFFMFLQDYVREDPRTHNGWDLTRMLMKDLFKQFGLEPETEEFVGHALALHLNDDYLNVPALDTIERCKLYFESLMRYSKSPYIYPLYGLGELPQAFARLAAIYGGTYMLNKPIEEVLYENGRFVGVRSEGEVARARFVVGDPSYFPQKTRRTGQVVRAICLLNHPVRDTNNIDSVQIIIPQRQVNRRSDIYIGVISSAHCVCSRGKYIAIVSTTVETADPLRELKPALDLLDPVLEQFLQVTDTFEPLADGRDDTTFISRSYDATSHFETTCVDVLDMYRRITGKDLIFKTPSPSDGNEANEPESNEPLDPEAAAAAAELDK